MSRHKLIPPVLSPPNPQPPSLSDYEEHILETISKRRNTVRPLSSSSSSKNRHEYNTNHLQRVFGEFEANSLYEDDITECEQDVKRPFYKFMRDHHKDVNSDVDDKILSDKACSIAVTGRNPPYFVYVLAFDEMIMDEKTGKEKRNSQTRCGVTKNPFRKHLQRNTRSLARCRYNKNGVGKWVLLTAVGPFESREAARSILPRVRKESRNQYFRPIYTMNMVVKAQRDGDYGGRKLVCFARHVTEDVPIDLMLQVPKEHMLIHSEFCPMDRETAKWLVGSKRKRKEKSKRVGKRYKKKGKEK
jgi:hypothetical protein